MFHYGVVQSTRKGRSGWAKSTIDNRCEVDTVRLFRGGEDEHIHEFITTQPNVKALVFADRHQRDFVRLSSSNERNDPTVRNFPRWRCDCCAQDTD